MPAARKAPVTENGSDRPVGRGAGDAGNGAIPAGSPAARPGVAAPAARVMGHPTVTTAPTPIPPPGPSSLVFTASR